MAWAHSHPSPQGQEVRPRETLGVGDRTEQWMPRLWTNNYGPVLTEKVWRALKSRQAVPHGEEMCPIPLHIPKAIQSFPLNMDITAKESGEGNLRIASELREFTLNWLNNMWNWEVAQKANLQKSTLFLFLHIWIYGQKYLSFSTILYLKTSLTSILLSSEALHPFFPVLPNFWRKWSILGPLFFEIYLLLIPSSSDIWLQANKLAVKLVSHSENNYWTYTLGYDFSSFLT